MVDIFALALSHGLLALAAWRLLSRPDLDVEGARAETTRVETLRGAKKPARRGMVWKQGMGKQEAGKRGAGEDA